MQRKEAEKQRKKAEKQRRKAEKQRKKAGEEAGRVIANAETVIADAGTVIADAGTDTETEYDTDNEMEDNRVINQDSNTASTIEVKENIKPEKILLPSLLKILEAYSEKFDPTIFTKIIKEIKSLDKRDIDKSEIERIFQEALDESKQITDCDGVKDLILHFMEYVKTI